MARRRGRPTQRPSRLQGRNPNAKWRRGLAPRCQVVGPWSGERCSNDATYRCRTKGTLICTAHSRPADPGGPRHCHDCEPPIRMVSALAPVDPITDFVPVPAGEVCQRCGTTGCIHKSGIL